MLKKTQLLSVAVLLTVILTACGVNQTPQPTYTPLPTYTPIPSPTITPTPQLKALFYTDASTPDARWDISESANGRRFVDKGMYNIEILSANYNIWGSHKELETSSDFILDFDVSFVSDGISAECPNNAAGFDLTRDAIVPIPAGGQPKRSRLFRVPGDAITPRIRGCHVPKKDILITQTVGRLV